MASAHVDAISETVTSYRERHESSRDDSDNHWLVDVQDNLTDAWWDAYDNFTDIPRRARNAYLDEWDRDDRDSR